MTEDYARLRNDRLKRGIDLLTEETRIKDARMGSIDSRHPPHCAPTDRMAILQLTAGRGWSQADAGRSFLVEPRPIANWLKRIDEDGPDTLVWIRASCPSRKTQSDREEVQGQ